VPIGNEIVDEIDDQAGERSRSLDHVGIVVVCIAGMLADA
jgi:hypothetical protein